MRLASLVILGAASLAGCAAPPLGPLVRVLPGPDKSYGQFVADDDECRAAANYRVAGQAQYANDRAVGVGVLTTVVGAGLGAAIGGGRGAAVGAVSGAGLGVGLGAGTSTGAQGGIQAQYDSVYAQCMYAHGNQLPGLAPPVVYQPAPAPYPAGLVGQDPRMVRDIQRQLRRHGYYPGPIDGIDSAQTAAAIQSFQAAHGLGPDGVPSPELLRALRATTPGY